MKLSMYLAERTLFRHAASDELLVNTTARVLAYGSAASDDRTAAHAQLLAEAMVEFLARRFPTYDWWFGSLHTLAAMCEPKVDSPLDMMMIHDALAFGYMKTGNDDDKRTWAKEKDWRANASSFALERYREFHRLSFAQMTAAASLLMANIVKVKNDVGFEAFAQALVAEQSAM